MTKFECLNLKNLVRTNKMKRKFLTTNKYIKLIDTVIDRALDIQERLFRGLYTKEGNLIDDIADLYNVDKSI